LAVEARSDPVALGTARADAQGNYRITVTVPANTTPGAHEVVVSGADRQGGTHRSITAITVVSAGGSAVVRRPRSGPLAFTGANLARLLALAIWLSTLGLAHPETVTPPDLGHDVTLSVSG
jgi:hypothetical protein